MNSGITCWSGCASSSPRRPALFSAIPAPYAPEPVCVATVVRRAHTRSVSTVFSLRVEAVAAATGINNTVGLNNDPCVRAQHSFSVKEIFDRCVCHIINYWSSGYLLNKTHSHCAAVLVLWLWDFP